MNTAISARFAIAAMIACACAFSALPACGQQTATIHFAEPVTKAVIDNIAPSGKLRVGLYPGSPSSFIPAGSGQAERGVGFELGRALAGALGIPFEPVVYQSNGELLAAAKQQQIDVVFTNATPARAAFLDFADPLLLIEQGYLVTPRSPAQRMADIDQASMRIGVSPGSTSQATLPGILKLARLSVADNLQVAAQRLNAGELDAFASNKGILFELSDKVPGSKVLDGAWGLEKISLGVPRGREQAFGQLRLFSRQAHDAGMVQAAAQRAGMRGFRID